jgi:tRNA A37 threonylcarbamoyladenosine dehydratase
LTFPQSLYAELAAHLFPGDGDEHGAIVLAGVHVRQDRVRLLARNLVLARDGVDHVFGGRGYKMIRAEFIHPLIRRARDERLVLLTVHNHGGRDRVAFSPDDLASHERGYPALLDIARGMPVGALVFAENAMAGDIWLPGGRRIPLEVGVVLGPRRMLLRPEPALCDGHVAAALYDRQVRLFGRAGQAQLAQACVGIIGLGGAGSILAELLARLGVRRFVLIDPDRADVSNLPRLIAARRRDVLMSDAAIARMGMLAPFLERLRQRKVDLAARNIRRANPHARVRRIFSDVTRPVPAAALQACDFLFLAADQMSARLVFNALVQQYLIPGIQVGARVVADAATGAVDDVYAVERWVQPGDGCLWCNGLINPSRLQLEAIGQAERPLGAYGAEEPAASVVSLNAIATSHAVNSFQMFLTGLANPAASLGYRRHRALSGRLTLEMPARSEACPECGLGRASRRARGDGNALPLRQR